MTDEVNNDLKLINNKKENERSDNGTTAMNDNEQGRSNASESGTINKMTTSTLGYKNNTSREIQNIPVDKSKVINEENDTPKGLTPHPQIALHPLSPSAWDEDAIFGTGEPQTSSMDNLSIQCEKTQPEPQECPQNEFNNS